MSKEVYLVLGGSSDVGVELIKRLNDEKNGVRIITSFNNNYEGLNEILYKNNNEILTYKVNLLEEVEILNFLDYMIKNDFVPTHIVHLPGNKFKYRKLKDFSWEDFSIDLNLQVKSLVMILKRLIPLMIKREKEINKKIVVMLSSNTLSIPPKFTLQYNMVKYALLGLVKSLASDLAGKNININGVSPSMINTKFLSEIDERLIEMTSLNMVGGEIAKVSDIVPIIDFLLSQDSNYINGCNINASNGNS